MDNQSVPAYVNGPTGQAPVVEPQPGEQPETSTTSTNADWTADLHCVRCGRRGGEGWVLVSQQSHCDRALATNEQLIRAGGWCYVYAHSCSCFPGSTGIDLPGVGVVASNPASGSPVELRSGRDNAAGRDRPDPVSVGGGETRTAFLDEEVLVLGSADERDESAEDRRERLFSQLLFAAKDLAEEQIEPAVDLEPAFCTECVKDAAHSGAIAHEDVCRTGRVLAVISELIGTLPHNHNHPSDVDLSPGTPGEKEEAATDEEAPEAGDGNRPQAFLDLVMDLGGLVRKADRNSALSGLKITAAAFGALLDIYAAPNAENPEGMCDDNAAFRKLFAGIIEGGAQ